VLLRAPVSTGAFFSLYFIFLLQHPGEAAPWVPLLSGYLFVICITLGGVSFVSKRFGSAISGV
jgi:hypothetical protein